MSNYHTPVMLNESIDAMNIQPDGIYVDTTFGGGGHSREILSRLTGNAHLYSFDQDADAEQNIITDDPRFTFVRGNFRYLSNFLRYYGHEQIDGILADLGVSSHHFDTPERGFSFRSDAPLDMRMNQRATFTAQHVVNNYTQEQLADIFYLYGEMHNARQLAATIVKARNQHSIDTIGDLLTATQSQINREHEKKDLARMFQALRIEVNHEMQALQQMLTQATQILRPGGRLVVITYHSLEDRLVKNIMKTGNLQGKEEKDFFGRISTLYQLVTRRPILPSNEEQESNPRSRSAKLRVAEKIESQE